MKKMFDGLETGMPPEQFQTIVDEYHKARELWPLTVIASRYGGTYEGGLFVAFHTTPWEVPEGAMDSDIECAEFYRHNSHQIGVGSTPQAAIDDLKAKLADK